MKSTVTCLILAQTHTIIMNLVSSLLYLWLERCVAVVRSHAAEKFWVYRVTLMNHDVAVISSSAASRWLWIQTHTFSSVCSCSKVPSQLSLNVWRRYGLSMVMAHFLRHSLCYTRSNSSHRHPADECLSLGVRWVWISVSSVCRSCWTTSLTLPCPETRSQCAVIFCLLFCYAAPAKNIWMSQVDLFVF